MSDAKSSVSKARSYEEIGEYWDTHDLADVWDSTQPADFTVTIDSEQSLVPIDAELSKQLRRVARRHGVSAQTLVNMWLQERVASESSG